MALAALLTFVGVLYWGRTGDIHQSETRTGDRLPFAENAPVYIESAEDFPNEPKGLHPTRLVVGQGAGERSGERSFDTPDFLGSHGVSSRTAGIFYFDDREHVVKTVSGSTLAQTRVTNSDLSGYFLVSNDGQQIAWSSGEFTNGETRATLKISAAYPDKKDLGRQSSQSLHSQTLSGQQAFVPLAWSADNQTVWYGQLSLDEQIAGVRAYSKLFQVNTDAEAVGPDAEPDAEREIAFPAKDLRGIGVDAERGRVFFLKEYLPTDSTPAAISPALVVFDLLTEEIAEYPLLTEFPIVSSIAQNGDFIALGLRSGEQTQNQVFLINTTTNLTQSLATLADKQEVVGFLDGDLLLSRGGINRGTWRVSLDGAGGGAVGAVRTGVESRVNTMRAIAIIPAK